MSDPGASLDFRGVTAIHLSRLGQISIALVVVALVVAVYLVWRRTQGR